MISSNIKKNEVKILKALYRLFTNAGKITMSRAALDEGIPVHFLLRYTNDHQIPLVMNDQDRYEALKKVVELFAKKNMAPPKN